jgi:peptidoglycan/LPS O-acetylase OafA/YrhL
MALFGYVASPSVEAIVPVQQTRSTIAGGITLGYRPALDGVRGLAIALVVGFHAFGWPGAGTLGVDLFFVLSGFLITVILIEEHVRTGTISIRGFYRRRARRLLPALFAMLTPYLLLAGFAALAGHGSALILALGGALTYTSNIIVAADPSAVPAGLIHLWSLAEEEQFYLIWPLLLVSLLRLGRRDVGRCLGVLLALVLVFRLVLVARGASLERLYYGPDTHGDPLIIGCVFGYWFKTGRLHRLMAAPRTRSLVGGAALALIVTAAILLDAVPQRLFYLAQLPTLFAVCAGVFIVSAASGGSAIALALSTRPLAFLGRISYSLYLWHLPLLVMFGVHRHFGLRGFAVIALSLIAATLSRYLVEIPFLRRCERPYLGPQLARKPATAMGRAG